ncbi:MAG: MBL fold metallo-hydrolase [Rhizobiales bacterium]|nr:MBL fold metallo-hydrolase [Hyphomicrobiales bacterium]MBI3674406.1 MBL fold metallo-hydrolase [Hyphomicrobiales bacterium]
MIAPDFDRRFEAKPGKTEQVSPLVRRVLCGNAGPFTFTGTSTFIVGRKTVAVIDPGPDDAAHLEALLVALGGETVSHILVTHSHADHSALAGKLAAATGAKTLAEGPVAQTGGTHARFDAGVDHAFTPDLRLAHGDVVTGPGWSLEALFTPGHMSNHMCFALKEERALFTGDHVMSWSTSVVAPPDGDMARYMQSLDLLFHRDDRVYLPAHGPERRDPLPYVRSLIAHRLAREAAILACLGGGLRSIPEIVSRLYADIDPRLHGAAALSVRAHLEKLVDEGKIRVSDGVYELAG